jgi:hypothetical protein
MSPGLPVEFPPQNGRTGLRTPLRLPWAPNALGSRKGFGVKLINTDGMAFIGPGSEWFWTAISGIVLAVTFIAIYRQLRLQRAANAFEQLSHLTEEWESEPLLRAKLRVALAIRAGEAELPYGPAAVLGNYWGTIGGLVRGGHVDKRAVYEAMGPKVQIWWALMQQDSRRLRDKQADDRIDFHFEWLASAFADLAATDGTAAVFDRDNALGRLNDIIAGCEQQIRMAEESRMVPKQRKLPAGAAARGS